MDKSLAGEKGCGDGIFLDFGDCKSIFPLLKENEYSLSAGERKILLEIEKILYGSLSIGEIDELLESNRRAAQ